MAFELGERYEQLRAVVLGGQPGGNGLGLGVLAGRGMAAWIKVWRSCPPPSLSVPATPADLLGLVAAGGSQHQLDRDLDRELVRVLAAMALAHIHL